MTDEKRPPGPPGFLRYGSGRGVRVISLLHIVAVVPIKREGDSDENPTCTEIRSAHGSFIVNYPIETVMTDIEEAQDRFFGNVLEYHVRRFIRN